MEVEGKEKTDPEPTKPTQTDPRQTDPTQTNPSRTNPGTDVMIGDVNGDSVVNMKDVLNLRKSLAGIDVDVDEVAADVNSDGAVNMKDVLVLRKYLAGIIDTLFAALQDPCQTTQHRQVERCSPDRLVLFFYRGVFLLTYFRKSRILKRVK